MVKLGCPDQDKLPGSDVFSAIEDTNATCKDELSKVLREVWDAGADVDTICDGGNDVFDLRTEVEAHAHFAIEVEPECEFDFVAEEGFLRGWEYRQWLRVCGDNWCDECCVFLAFARDLFVVWHCVPWSDSIIHVAGFKIGRGTCAEAVTESFCRFDVLAKADNEELAVLDIRVDEGTIGIAAVFVAVKPNLGEVLALLFHGFLERQTALGQEFLETLAFPMEIEALDVKSAWVTRGWVVNRLGNETAVDLQ